MSPGTIERRARVGYVGLSLCAFVLAAMIANPDSGAGARFGATGALIGIVAAVMSMMRLDRHEHADDDTPRRWSSSFTQAMSWTGAAWIGIATFLAAIFIVTVRHGHGIAAVFVAVIAVAALAAAVLSVLPKQRVEGVEREQVLVSGAIAFFAVMAATAAYGVAEAVLDAPHLSMWWVYAFGMAVWALGSLIYRRRVS